MELVECVLVRSLDIREIYWIREYDCCLLDGKEKGYNVSRGGSGFKKYILDEKDITKKYIAGTSINQLSAEYHVAFGTIFSILIKNGIELRTSRETTQLKQLSYGQTILQFDKQGNLLRTFPSQSHSARWIFEECDGVRSIKSIKASIRSAFLLGHQAYGYFWKIDGIEEADFQTQKERVLSAKRLNSHANYRKKRKSKKCAYGHCDSLVNEKSTYCQKHAYLANSKLPLTKCPSDILEVVKKVCSTSFVAAGEYYDVSPTSIKKWLEKNGLPCKIADLKQYAIDHNVIKDPKDNLPDKLICERFLETGGLLSTARLFHCSKDDVVLSCLNQGMTIEEIEAMNKKACHKCRSKKVAQHAENGETVRIYNSIGEASRETGISRIHITEECKGHRKTSYNWKFVE